MKHKALSADKPINMHEAKSRLSQLVEAIESGAESEITIARNGKPVARLVPIPVKKPIRLGLARGKFTFDYDAFQAMDGEVQKLVRLLLDTHIALWAVAGAPDLPRRAQDIIEDSANETAVSLVSLWEIAIKNGVRRGGRGAIRLSVQEAAAEFTAANFELQAFDVEVLRALEDLPLHHGDPFDRLLIATAMTCSYRLVTHDKALAAYGDHILLV